MNTEHIYKVYECYPDDKKHDTGKTIVVPNNIFTDGYMNSSLALAFVTSFLSTMYNFNNAYASYYVLGKKDKNYTINYNYAGEGVKNTWFLELIC